jgi:3-deoxy-D-manno-octulosonic-acid transferase
VESGGDKLSKKSSSAYVRVIFSLRDKCYRIFAPYHLPAIAVLFLHETHPQGVVNSEEELWISYRSP